MNKTLHTNKIAEAPVSQENVSALLNRRLKE